jgi:chaperonin GroEL
LSNPKNTLHGIKAREAFLRGALTLSKAVAVTYGAHGRTVMLDRASGLLATRDGVTVAREVDLSDPVENLGAQILKEACTTVNDEVGDGTTTTAILAGELLREGHKLVAAGMDPSQVISGMRDAADDVERMLQDIAVPVAGQEGIETVARLASNGDDEVAKCMAEACMAVGKDGTVLIEDGHGLETTLELKEGMEIERGAATAAFFTEKLERTMEGPLVAVINKHLRTVEDVTDLLEVASQFKPRELLLIVDGIEGPALATMSINNSQGVVASCAVQSPGFGPHKADVLRDIAALAGATFVDPAAGHDIGKFEAEWFGAFRQAIIRTKTSTFTAYDDNHADLEAYIARIRSQTESGKSDYDRDRVKERLAKLSGGLAVIRVGGVTEAAMKERRGRVEDALGAVRAALRGGLVPGAGTALVIASVGLGEAGKQPTSAHEAGWEAVRQAILAPVGILAGNSGAESGLAIGRVTEAHAGASDGWVAFEDTGGGAFRYRGKWIGWDTKVGGLRDLRETPMLVDPALVVISALKAAVSVATTLLTVEVSLTQKLKGA